MSYFSDTSINHGNFLEILRTASIGDPLLQSHLNKCVEAAERVIPQKGPRGRGSKVAFLGKITINKFIQITRDEMKGAICTEVKNARIFSIMCDNTQDIVGHEQCAVVVRYVNSETFAIEERLLGVVRLHHTTGHGYFKTIWIFLIKIMGLIPNVWLAAHLTVLQT